mmetsp:Transcript_96598/g.311971  ORF Transcript_96598/g.311971 Transcript_96598/m.311971 type:complete len:293 (+) Transcript_96598:1052-1930(+)
MRWLPPGAAEVAQPLAPLLCVLPARGGGPRERQPPLGPPARRGLGPGQRAAAPRGPEAGHGDRGPHAGDPGEPARHPAHAQCSARWPREAGGCASGALGGAARCPGPAGAAPGPSPHHCGRRRLRARRGGAAPELRAAARPRGRGQPVLPEGRPRGRLPGHRAAGPAARAAARPAPGAPPQRQGHGARGLRRALDTRQRAGPQAPPGPRQGPRCALPQRRGLPRLLSLARCCRSGMWLPAGGASRRRSWLRGKLPGAPGLGQAPLAARGGIEALCPQGSRASASCAAHASAR